MSPNNEVRALKIKARHCKDRMLKLKPHVEAYERVKENLEKILQEIKKYE